MNTDLTEFDRLTELILSSRRAAESAIGLAMVTSCIPGLEVRFAEGECPESPAIGPACEGPGA